MKMIRCVVRPEREEAVMASIETEGFSAFTKMDVLGRGKQSGIQIGQTRYDELAKTLFMLVVEEEDLGRAVAALSAGARTGNPGDGKIFVSEVDEVHTIRTGERSL
ncbi:MAG: P-II family nitrogen regulator [candidate division FCPU426 bacterium]